MLARLSWALVVLALTLLGGFIVILPDGQITYALAAFAVAAVAAVPKPALLALLPVAMWPSQSTVAGLPLSYGLTAVVIAGVTIRHILHWRESQKLILLTASFIGAMGYAFISHGAPIGLTRSEQLNHFIAFLLGVSLISATALAKPPLVATLRVLAASGVAAAGYNFFFSDRVGGRASSEDLNSDVLGGSAALTILVILALASVDRRRAWLLLLPIPLATFIAAQTRSALLLLTIGLIAMFLLRRVGPGRVLATCLSLAALPFLIEPALALQEKLFSKRDARFLEVDSRFETLKLALELIREQPWLGHGYRHFPDIALSRLGETINAHNDYALIAAENGIIAAVLFICIVARAVTFRTDDLATDSSIRAVLLGGLAVLAFGNMVTDLRMTAPTWILLGLAWTWGTGKNPGFTTDASKLTTETKASDVRKDASVREDRRF